MCAIFELRLCASRDTFLDAKIHHLTCNVNINIKPSFVEMLTLFYMFHIHACIINSFITGDNSKKWNKYKWFLLLHLESCAAWSSL